MASFFTTAVSSGKFVGTFTNMYVVSPYALGINNGTSVWDASNAENASATTELEGIVHYETMDDMPKEKGTYADFEASGFWHLDENGRPVWGKAAANA